MKKNSVAGQLAIGAHTHTHTQEDLHNPLGSPGGQTPPPSPLTPVFSPLPYTPLSSAEVERMINCSKTPVSLILAPPQPLNP